VSREALNSPDIPPNIPLVPVPWETASRKLRNVLCYRYRWIISAAIGKETAGTAAAVIDSRSPHLEVVYLLQGKGIGDVQQLPHVLLASPGVGVRMQQNGRRRCIQRERRLLHDDRRLGRSLPATAGTSAFRI